ncbi:MAG: hypothetical protein EHM55_03655 [Acidobacteria bacterium]|nr:MAG: hypothetical protein EHM55_03655 [Acidobacteriota bacterium]
MRLPLVILLAVILSTCSAFSPALPNSLDSPEALARAVLQAVERQDVDALSRLALNEQEFREQVWPDLPASRPERNLPFSYVWGDLRQKSETQLKQMLAEYGGKKFELVSIRFRGDATTYASYRVHRESELMVKDPEGRERQVRLFGSVLEKNRRYKVFSYVNND